MKKTLLLVAAVISGNLLFGQTQRLDLLEEFTQASCGPCAAYNPGFNSLVSSNTAKAVSIKYQTSWPGVDPMNAQNPGEVQTRVTYYGVTGVPDVQLDGVDKSQSTTQTDIDNDYAVPAPFSITPTFWFNTAQDSIFINVDVTASQNGTYTTPKLRVAMVEKTIHFTTAPGSNGETDFYNVMRKMYPDANGTTLATTWTTGQKKVMSWKAKIPTYIYQKSQIAIVAFIQDDGASKAVKQAAFAASPSTPLAQPPVADFMADATTSCDGLIHFYDQSGLFPTSWSWDFGDATTSTLQNPTHKYASNGTYTVKLTAANANGNNQATKTAYVTVNLSGTAPTGTNGYICNSGVVNLSASGSGTLNWYDANGNMVHTGTTYSPNISGTTNFWVSSMTANPVKSEGAANNSIGAGSTYTAAATQGPIFDMLKSGTIVSAVCYASTAGTRTITVTDAGGNVVATATPNIPSGTSTVTLNIHLNAGTGYTMMPNNACNLYRNTAGAVYPYNASGVMKITGNTAANNAYYYFFYNMQVQQDPCASPATVVSGIDSCSATGVAFTEAAASLDIYPNPSNGNFTASFQTFVQDNYTVKITNLLGEVVYSEALNSFSGSYSRQMNISEFGKGMYMLSISNSKNETVRKVLVY